MCNFTDLQMPNSQQSRARIFELLRSLGIDTNKSIPPDYICSLAVRYDNPLPSWFLAPIDCSKIPVLGSIPCCVIMEWRAAEKAVLNEVLEKKNSNKFFFQLCQFTFAMYKTVHVPIFTFYNNHRTSNSNVELCWESIEWFIEELAFLWSFDSAPTPPPPPPSPVSKLSLFLSLPCVSPVQLTEGKGGVGGCGRSQIIRPRESLALHKTFNTLWLCSTVEFVL